MYYNRNIDIFFVSFYRKLTERGQRSSHEPNVAPVANYTLTAIDFSSD